VHPVRSLLIYIASVFLLAALIAPWIFWLTQWMAGHFPVLEDLARSPFHRYVNRSLLFFAVLGLWPFLWSLGGASWESVGLLRPAGHWRRLAEGFLLGFATLAAAGSIALLVGSRRWDPRLGVEILAVVPGITATALIVALLEETLFRGTLFGSLRRQHEWKVALVISSAFYAAMHFFKSVKAPPEITWTSGFEQLGRMMGGFVDPERLMPGLLSLTITGMALGIAYQRTGNLYFSLGLHAGWVFWLKTFNALTVAGPHAKGALRVSRNLYDGWLGLAVSVGAFLVVCFLTDRRKARDATP
jgi:membrane protease YdiL (CAAX protease family)